MDLLFFYLFLALNNKNYMSHHFIEFGNDSTKENQWHHFIFTFLMFESYLYISENALKQEYKENSAILVNCSSILNTYLMRWTICIDGTTRLLCERFGVQKDCSFSDFNNRIQYVDPGTIKVSNMKMDESGVVGCMRSKPDPGMIKVLYEAVFIGNNLNDYFKR